MTVFLQLSCPGLPEGQKGRKPGTLTESLQELSFWTSERKAGRKEKRRKEVREGRREFMKEKGREGEKARAPSLVLSCHSQNACPPGLGSHLLSPLTPPMKTSAEEHSLRPQRRHPSCHPGPRHPWGWPDCSLLGLGTLSVSLTAQKLQVPTPGTHRCLSEPMLCVWGHWRLGELDLSHHFA